MARYEIPTRAQAERFSISLAGVVYQITLRWNGPASCWIMDIVDSGGAALVAGIPVLPGVDLLAQHKHLGIGGQIMAAVDGAPAAVPDYAGMGTTGHLYFTASQ